MPRETAYEFRANDEQFMARFDAVLGDVGALHMRVVQWVKDQGILEDDAAIHAAAFSIKTEVLKTLGTPGLVVYMPTGKPAEMLRDWELYRATIPVEEHVARFVDLVVELADNTDIVPEDFTVTNDDVRSALNQIPRFGRRSFNAAVTDYYRLALGLIAMCLNDEEEAEEQLFEAGVRSE